MFNRRKFQEAWNSGKSILKSNCWRDQHGVVYHQTRVVEFTQTGARLWSGGWRTPTTKDHINVVLSMMGIDCHIYQRNNVWYVAGQGLEPMEFKEGMDV